MAHFYSFKRTVRQELQRISMRLKQMEFKILRLRGVLKRKLRDELRELKRVKDSILRRLFTLSPESPSYLPAMQSIRDDMTLLHMRCHALRTQHF